MNDGPPKSKECRWNQAGACDYGKFDYKCPGVPLHSKDYSDWGCVYSVCNNLEKYLKEIMTTIDRLDEKTAEDFIKKVFIIVSVETDEGKKDLLVRRKNIDALTGSISQTFKGKLGVDEEVNIYLPPHYFHTIPGSEGNRKYHRNREFEFSFKEFVKFSDFLDKAFKVLRRK